MPRRDDKVPTDQGHVAEMPERKPQINGQRGAFGLEPSVLTRRTGLYLPTDLSLGAWQLIGQQLFAISDSSAWWWGDWLIFGEKRYADRYQRAIAETSLDYQTLRNYAWVARRFPVSRRRDGLSFQHHASVAALPDAEQEELLTQAEKHGWTRNELRRRLRQQRRPATTPPAQEVVYQLNVDPDRRTSWQQAASRAHEALTAWMMHSLDQAADALLAQAGSATTSAPDDDGPRHHDSDSSLEQSSSTNLNASTRKAT